MIYPYKWKITAHWLPHASSWLVNGQFLVGKQAWNIPSYQDDKEDISEINEAVRTFWRKRGAM